MEQSDLASRKEPEGQRPGGAGQRRWKDRYHTRRCLHPFCSALRSTGVLYPFCQILLPVALRIAADENSSHISVVAVASEVLFCTEASEGDNAGIISAVVQLALPSVRRFGVVARHRWQLRQRRGESVVLMGELKDTALGDSHSRHREAARRNRLHEEESCE